MWSTKPTSHVSCPVLRRSAMRHRTAMRSARMPATFVACFEPPPLPLATLPVPPFGVRLGCGWMKNASTSRCAIFSRQPSIFHACFPRQPSCFNTTWNLPCGDAAHRLSPTRYGALPTRSRLPRWTATSTARYDASIPSLRFPIMTDSRCSRWELPKSRWFQRASTRTNTRWCRLRQQTRPESSSRAPWIGSPTSTQPPIFARRFSRRCARRFQTRYFKS